MCDATACSKCNGGCGESKLLDSPDSLPIITGGFLIVTEKCNLACEYCFVNQHARDMSIETALDCVDYIYENASKSNQQPSINFFGGEPLLRWKDIIVPVIEYSKEKNYNISFGLTTNGVLLDEEKLKYMKDNNVGLLFSIDGDCDTQDINRPFHGGKGSSQCVNSKIELVLKYYPKMTFRATISNLSVQHTFHNMKYAIEKGYVNLFTIPNVFARWTEEQKQTLKDEMRKFSDYYIELFRQGKVINYSPYDRLYPQLLQINENNEKGHVRPFYGGVRGQGKCGLGSNRHVSFGVDGNMYGCQEMVTDYSEDNVFTIGNIYKGVDNEKRLNLVNSFDRKLVRSTTEKCESCRFNLICDGGCVANNYIANKDVNVMCEMYCIWMKILINETEYICDVLGKERNMLFKKTCFGGKRNVGFEYNQHQ